jgi:hypothetical protein
MLLNYAVFLMKRGCRILVNNNFLQVISNLIDRIHICFFSALNKNRGHSREYSQFHKLF